MLVHMLPKMDMPLKKLVVAALLSLLSCLNAVAAPLVVVTDESLPPYSFVRGNDVVGIDVDMLTEAAKRLSLDLKITALPWKRVFVYVKEGRSPLAMPLFRTAEREEFCLFTGPVHYSVTGIFVKKGKEFRFDNIGDLNGKRLGYNRGFVIQDDLDKAIATGTVIAEEVRSIEQNFGKLMAGRIDVFSANVVSTQYVMRDSPFRNEISMLPKLLTDQRPAYLVVSKAANLPGKEELIASLTVTLKALYQDGTYDKIVKRYVN